MRRRLTLMFSFLSASVRTSMGACSYTRALLVTASVNR